MKKPFLEFLKINDCYINTDESESSEYHLKLTSGLCSNEFFNLSNLNSYRLLEEALLLSELFNTLKSRRYEYDYDCVCGQALGSIALATVISNILSLPFIFTEKVDEDMVIKRFDITKYSKILMVEDVITTGKTTIKSIENVNISKIADVCTLINRSSKDYFVTDNKIINIFAGYKSSAKVFKPEKCPYCKQGSKALRPKANWQLLKNS